MLNKILVSGIESLEKNTKLTFENLENLSLNQLIKINVSDDKATDEVEALIKNLKIKLIKFKVVMNFYHEYLN